MNKKIIVSVAAVSVLVFSGCSLFGRGGQDQGGAPEQEEQGAVGEIKKSLLDFMTTGAGVKCSVEDESGKYTMYAKGEKAKVEGFNFGANPTTGQPSEEKGTMINDGTWAYMWSGKEGIKFNIKEMEALAPKDQQQPEEDSQAKASAWKDWVKEMDQSGAKHDCGAAVLTDADFTPPADVKFQDWGEMMKGFMQGAQQNIPQDLPQNIP